VHMLSTQRWMVAVVGSLVLSWKLAGHGAGAARLLTELVEVSLSPPWEYQH